MFNYLAEFLSNLSEIEELAPEAFKKVKSKMIQNALDQIEIVKFLLSDLDRGEKLESVVINLTKEKGEKIEKKDIREIENRASNFQSAWPPEPLTNEEKNKKVLSLFSPELIVYIRTIHHPRRKFDESSRYIKYLRYLGTIEDYPKDCLKYLVSGIKKIEEIVEKDNFYQYEESWETEIQDVENLIRKIKKDIDGDHIKISTNENELSVKFDERETGYVSKTLKKHFYKEMDDLGFYIKPVDLML